MTGIATMKELEVINKGWKNCTMISLRTSRKMKMNLFMSCHKWADIALNNELAKGCMLIQISENRYDKTAFYASLYSEFYNCI